MSLPDTLFAEPFAMMAATPLFPSEAVIGGPMDSPVALGVVLIFKASGVPEFARGAMVPFAALDHDDGRELADGTPHEVGSGPAAAGASLGVVHG